MQRGFSLVEAMMTLLIFSVLGQVALTLVVSGVRIWSREVAAVDLQNDLTGAKSIVLDELITAGFSPDGTASGKTAFRAVTAGTASDRVQFVADVDSDGVSELVTYAIADGRLERSRQRWNGSGWEVPTTDVVGWNVQSFTVTFFDAAGSTLPAAEVVSGGTSSARTVNVSLVAGRPVRGEVIARAFLGSGTFRN